MTLPTPPGATFEDSSLLALWAPNIPALITPLDGDEGYDGGIGADALETDLLVIVDPWFDMAIGDRCLLFWDDAVNPMSTEIIDTEEKLDKPCRFYVPKGQILDGSAFPVFYRLIRASHNEIDSIKLNVLIKRTLPGGVLDKPEPLGHPRLRYSFNPDISTGVDGDMAKNGIAMHIEPYQNITVYDSIVARWGNNEEADHYSVTPDQIKDPLNHPILISFDEQLIKRAGDGRHLVTYQVIDRCGNRPHVNAPWAIPTEVTVNLLRIPAPTVTGEQGGVLDTAYVTKIEAVASGVGLIAGDSVWINWQGRVERETTTVPYSGSGVLRFPIPLNWANESTESAVSVTTRVRRAGRPLTSEPRNLTIKTTIELKPPRVLEAYGPNGDRLKMADIYEASHVTIQVQKYLGMAIGQTIRARWASSRHVYDSAITTVTTVGPMTFNVPRLEVVDAIGSTVPVSFTVRTYPNGPLHRSDALLLAVDAQKFVLTPPRLTPDRTTVTVRYPGMVTGYHACVRLTGVVTRETDWQDLQTDVTEEFSIPANWIEENKGRTVLINYSVNRPGIDEQSMFSQVLRVDL
ncbi:hypothetical protein [Pseudomonas sp. HLT2-19-2]